MKKGFTLFETFLVLLILGIIAGLLMPRVMTSFNDKSYVAGIQRAYTGVEEAVKRMMVDETVSSVSKSTLRKSGSDTAKNTAGKFMKKYFNIVQDCGTSKSSCLASKYININGKDITKKVASGDFYCATLDTMAAICISPMTSESAVVYVDVNGVKKPNIAGKDLFMFHIQKDGTVKDNTSSSDCKNTENAGGCFKKLKKNDWEMNY